MNVRPLLATALATAPAQTPLARSTRDWWQRHTPRTRMGLIAAGSATTALVTYSTTANYAVALTVGAALPAGIAIMLYAGRWILLTVTTLAVVAFVTYAAQPFVLAVHVVDPVGAAAAGIIIAGLSGIALAAWSRPPTWWSWPAVTIAGFLTGWVLLTLVPGWGLNAARAGTAIATCSWIASSRALRRHRMTRRLARAVH